MDMGGSGWTDKEGMGDTPTKRTDSISGHQGHPLRWVGLGKVSVVKVGWSHYVRVTATWPRPCLETWHTVGVQELVVKSSPVNWV